MRLKVGDPVLLFDNRSGEWLAVIADAAKRSLTLRIERQTRGLEQVPDLWLCFAPVKKARLDWIIEKATELGVRRLQPVITERTIVERVKHERLEAQIVEACEQCGRTALPSLAEPVKLPQLLASWPADRALLFADEAGGAPLAKVAAPAPAAILTGPEGGFTARERDIADRARRRPPHRAWPAHPARRNRGYRRRQPVDGAAWRLVRRVAGAANSVPRPNRISRQVPDFNRILAMCGHSGVMQRRDQSRYRWRGGQCLQSVRVCLMLVWLALTLASNPAAAQTTTSYSNTTTGTISETATSCTGPMVRKFHRRRQCAGHRREYRRAADAHISRRSSRDARFAVGHGGRPDHQYRNDAGQSERPVRRQRCGASITTHTVEQ